MRRYESSLALSVILSSSSDPSTLSNALAVATGDLGEVGLIRCPALLVELAWPAFPEIWNDYSKQEFNTKENKK